MRKTFVACWFVCTIIFPIVGYALVVGLGFQVLSIPIGLGGSLYALLLTPFIFSMTVAIYYSILAQKKDFEEFVFSSYVWLLLIPFASLILWLLFTTSTERGSLLISEILQILI